MGWFDDQIKQRKSFDDEDFSEVMAELSDTVTGRKSAVNADENAKIRSVIDIILRHYHCKPKEIPESITDLDRQIEYACRPYGIMRREVTLEGKWYRDAVGAMLGRKKDGTPVALIPNKTGGYSIVESGKRTRLNKWTAKLLEREAYCFYKPFPMKKIGVPALIKYIIQSVPVTSFVAVIAIMILATTVGMIGTNVTHIIFSDVIESGSIRMLLAAAVLSISVGISSLMIDVVKSLVTNRINTRMNISVQAAVMARIISLPADFFKNYSSGELAERSQYINSLCNTLVSAFVVTGLSTVFSLAYISQIFVFAPTLVVPALCISLLTLGYSVFSTLTQMRERKAEMLIASKVNGMTYSLITGIQKVKLAGAEKRAFTRWAKLYNEEIKHSFGRPKYMIISNTIGLAITLLGTIVMYCFAVESGVSVADYYAFTAAYGVVSGAFMSLTEIALNAAQIRPVLDMVKPVLDAIPEISEDKQIVERLTGAIELNGISFRYNDSMPNVIDDLTLKIRQGQYVAIVGKTGCGKSTLVRLLLGFEKPQKGAIYYDGRDMQSLDPKSLRRSIGTVVQNGRLLQGSIFDNICISKPELTLDEAWEAAELAGIADDIREMPMGMQTMISEGSGGISGGQKQRIMIARAVAPKPKILIFDEATSALDNITQKKISESLDSLKCTRIVIAHRLSTIRHCDRIIVLDGGKIVEDGTYEQLIEHGGFFAELVERQRVTEAHN